ncbi:hypothetical protein Cgig2_031624 [Carnegiea gigantea]|uniref:Uncharacterized protein n=1 Tax=Carnegiea gigantea TaxID=171969 RepID=A0A9Q1QEC7_9CARY|nr:hypothetical protein Cgig2_031624 [Carnegiea gigantea]
MEKLKSILHEGLLFQVKVDNEKKDGFNGEYDVICNARLPRGLNPHSVPSDALATSLGEHMAHINRIIRRRRPIPRPSNHSPISDHELSEAETYVLKSIRRKWSNFKVNFKLEHYEPNCGNVTAIISEHRPDCVPKDQWISLATYWISDKGKDMINEILNQLPGGKEVTNGNVAREGDVYSQVMKEVKGEERRGLEPSSLASLSSTQCREHLDDDHDQCSERMEFLEAENKRLQDKLTRLEGQQTEV